MDEMAKKDLQVKLGAFLAVVLAFQTNLAQLLVLLQMYRVISRRPNHRRTRRKTRAARQSADPYPIERETITEDAHVSSFIEVMNNIRASCEDTCKSIRDAVAYFNSLSADLNDGSQGKVYQGLVAIEDLGMSQVQMLRVGDIIALSPATANYLSLPMSARKVYAWNELSEIWVRLLT